MNNIQDQGRACYKRGDYKKAIEYFDRAIGRSPSVQLLDNRAACYEKLGEYKDALADAKKTIQLHREDAVGYLRAGRILVKMEKPSVALEIYTSGLKRIRHVGQGYMQLRKVHKHLMDQLCPPKSLDPMTVLPRELAETILEHLSFRQRMNACLVSKDWAQFIRSVPNLWRHFDLSGARRKVRTAFVSRVINIARTRLSTASLSNLYDFDKTLSALVKHCPVEELTLLECGLQSHSLTAILAPAKTLRSLKISQWSPLNSHELRPLIAALADRLETLDCWVAGRQSPGQYHVPCHKLNSLSLTFDDPFNHSAFFDKISDHFPALHTLIVRQDDFNPGVFPAQVNLQDCKELRHLEFRFRSGALHQLRFPPGLKILKLDCQSPLPIPAANLPVLEQLGVAGTMRFADVKDLLNMSVFPGLTEPGQDPETEPSKLQKLSITASHCVDNVDMMQLLSHPRLESIGSLCLAGCSGLADAQIAALATSKLKKLRSIDLTSADLTGVLVRVLVMELKLDTLILNECRNVSPDAVDWAREKGVVVKYRMSDASAGGRKVRY